VSSLWDILGLSDLFGGEEGFYHKIASGDNLFAN
jgi:hypothetical protein